MITFNQSNHINMNGNKSWPLIRLAIRNYIEESGNSPFPPAEKDEYRSLVSHFFDSCESDDFDGYAIAKVIFGPDDNDNLKGKFLSRKTPNFETELYVSYNHLFKKLQSAGLVSKKFVRRICPSQVSFRADFLVPLIKLNPAIRQTDIVHSFVDNTCVSSYAGVQDLFDYNFLNDNGETPLIYAINLGETMSALRLLEIDALDVRILGPDGQSAFDLARKLGYENICTMITRHKSNKSLIPPSLTPKESLISAYELKSLPDYYDAKGNKYTPVHTRGTVISALTNQCGGFMETTLLLPANIHVFYKALDMGRMKEITILHESLLTVVVGQTTIAHLLDETVCQINKIVLLDAGVEICMSPLYEEK